MLRDAHAGEPRRGRALVALACTIWSASVAGCDEGTGNPPSSEGASPRSVAGSPEGGRIVEMVLEDFSIEPPVIRLAEGEPVVLRIRNAGTVAHEFVVGREPTGDMFRVPFFSGVDVETRGPVAAAEVDPEAPSRAPPRHPEDDVHPRVMVHLPPGEEATLSFRAPSSHLGEWLTACFVPGHLERGMQGRLLVDRAGP